LQLVIIIIVIINCDNADLSYHMAEHSKLTSSHL